MSDEPNLGETNASVNPPASDIPPPPAIAPHSDFRIGEEFGTAKRNLPPARIVLAAIAGILVIVGIVAFKGRAMPQGAGTINFVQSVDVPGQNLVLAAITFTLKNKAQKPLWVHTLKAQISTPDGKSQEDEAASIVDLERYFQAFPALKESAEPPLGPEAKLLPGAEQRGTMIVGFKTTKEDFDRRKSLTVSIQPYDQPLPILLK
jgi:hypothetical protein